MGGFRLAVAVVAAAIFAATFSGGAWGQVAAPGPAPDCMTYLLNASDCLTFVTAGSNSTKPDKGCCPELAGLVEGNPVCLCYLLASHNSFGIEIDVKKAMKLPSICSVTTPPVSLCTEIGIPVGAPTSTSSDEMAPMGAPTSTQPSFSPDAGGGAGGIAPAAASPGGATTSAASKTTIAASALHLSNCNIILLTMFHFFVLCGYY